METTSNLKHLARALAVGAGLMVGGAQATDLGKLMPMGDSITLGVPVAGGYRDPLYTLLDARGDTFTFVGSLTDYATTTLSNAGQTHHEGHSGYTIADGGGRSGLDQGLAGWIGSGAEDPDKILLMIGSNDINIGYDMPNAPTRLSTLITHIYGYRPNVKLYVASIIPMSCCEPDVQAFNAAIPGIVASHRALGQDVVYVPMYESLNINTDLADGLHPNALGYQHMAQAWDTALSTASPLPLTLTVSSPANNQAFLDGAAISATATVAGGTPPYTVTFFTNNGSGTGVQVGSPVTSSPYTVTVGTPPVGFYGIYATVSDSASGSAASATNAFTVASLSGTPAVDVTSAGSGPQFGDTFSVGWDFTVSQTITVTSLGQFDPDSNPQSNTVAIYRRGGAKLVEASVLATSPAVQSGIYPVRSVPIAHLVLVPGDYVVFSTQNGDNFIAPFGAPTATIGIGITWNKGVALGAGSAAGPLPATAPDPWPIENNTAPRYFGPTFTYELGEGSAPLTLTVSSPANNQAFLDGAAISATATVAGGTAPYTVTFFTNNGSGTGVQVGSPVTSSPYTVTVGTPPVGSYGIYATVSDSASGSATSATDAFTVIAASPLPLTLTVSSPANNQAFLDGAAISATATVAGGTPPYTVTFFTNNGSGTGVQVGSPVTSSPYTVTVGTPPVGSYGIYATVSDSASGSAASATNAFTVASLSGTPAVDVTSAGSGPQFGDTFSVGWDFTVNQTITVTSLGQFDPDSNPQSNTVAIYRRGGAKLVEASVLATSPAVQSGIYPVRSVPIAHLVLVPGDYVVFSTQNGDNFIAPFGAPTATIGIGITWNKGVALGAGSAAGPLPATAPDPWPIENNTAPRYFGPTFTYDLGEFPATPAH